MERFETLDSRLGFSGVRDDIGVAGFDRLDEKGSIRTEDGKIIVMTESTSCMLILNQGS